MKAPYWIFVGGAIVVILALGFLAFVVSRNLAVSGQASQAVTPTATPIGVAASAGQNPGMFILFILIAGAGMLYIWRRQRSLYNSIKAAERPSVDRRIRSGVAQLNSMADGGSPIVEERLRGVDVLDKVARESPQDQIQVVELLAEYVRRATPLAPDLDTGATEPREDVEAALTAIISRQRRRSGGPDERLNLSNCDLRGAHLLGAYLQGANLASTRLDGANLVNAYLDDADLTNTNLTQANLQGARGLTKAQLQLAIVDQTTRLPDDLE